jgi:plastocyanin
MTRIALVALLVATVIPPATAGSEAPSRVQVSADEFSLALSRLSLTAGPTIVELVNYGEDDHDLALRRSVKGARTYRIGIVPPEETGELETRLRPGRYTLWCTLPRHRARGMVASLLVRAPRVTRT